MKHTIVDNPSKIAVQFSNSGVLNDFGYTYQFDKSAIQASLANYQIRLPNATNQLYSAIDKDCQVLIKQLFPRMTAMPAEQVIRHLNLSTSAGRNHPSQSKRQALHLPECHVFSEVRPGVIYPPGSPEATAIQMVKGFRSKVREHQDYFPCSLGIKPKCYKYELEEIEPSTFNPSPECQMSVLERHQETKVISKTKGRIIWSVPIEVVLFEGQYACPYYQWIKTHQDCPIMLGRDNKARMFRYVTEVHDKVRVTLDWSQFDSRVPSWLIAIVLNHLIRNVDFLYGEDVDKIVAETQSYFIHTRVVSDSFGVDFTKHQGIPSGSMWTQIVGSICNMLVVRYCLNLRGVYFGDHLVLGDDTIFALTVQDRAAAEMVLQQLAADAMTFFGFNLSTQKCDISPPGCNVSFIGFTVAPDGREVPNYDKIRFKLRYTPQVLTLDQEKIRFLALYYIGGYAIPEFQAIARYLDFTNVNAEDIDQETEKKLKYVLGLEVKDLINPGFKVTQVNVDLLEFGWTPAGIRPVQVPPHTMKNPAKYA